MRDVLLSGGDALLFSDDKLEKILSRLRAIPHIEFLRIGTRVPIFLPQRITPELCAMLQKYHPLWMSVHVNHPRELTIEVKEALERLANHGIPLGNQSVLLKGVNDDLETMKTLVHKLLMCRVRPYYIYQCDLINGSSHLRTSVAKGIEIIEGLRGHTTGYAVPQFVIDAPGGGGKVPINPGYVLYHDNEKIVIRNYEGQNLRISGNRRRRNGAVRARSANITTNICIRNPRFSSLSFRAQSRNLSLPKRIRDVSTALDMTMTCAICEREETLTRIISSRADGTIISETNANSIARQFGRWSESAGRAIRKSTTSFRRKSWNANSTRSTN